MAFTPPTRSRGAEAEPRVCGGEIWGDLLWGRHFRISGETSSLGSAYGDLHISVTRARTSTKMVQPVTHLVTHTHTNSHNTHSYVNTQTYSYTHNTFSHIYSHYTWTCITLSHTFTQCYMHANPHTYTHIPSIYKHITCKFTLSYTHTHIYMPSHECTYTHITVQMYTGLCRAYWVTSGHEGRGRRPPNCLQNIS